MHKKGNSRYTRLLPFYVVVLTFFIPKINLKIPLINLGFFTTITFIAHTSANYLQLAMPSTITVMDKTTIKNFGGQKQATSSPKPKDIINTPFLWCCFLIPSPPFFAFCKEHTALKNTALSVNIIHIERYFVTNLQFLYLLSSKALSSLKIIQ